MVGQADLVRGVLTVGGIALEDSRGKIRMDLAFFSARKGERYEVPSPAGGALRIEDAQGRAWVAERGTLVDRGAVPGPWRRLRLEDVAIVPVPDTGAVGAATLDGDFVFPFPGS